MMVNWNRTKSPEEKVKHESTSFPVGVDYVMILSEIRNKSLDSDCEQTIEVFAVPERGHHCSLRLFRKIRSTLSP
ncbi:unnamed protein product [Amoebophrya sp. A25]|nr:unnamed protein product [Amoebophrya sp. A25]|eukprot:GSA25T00026183001.1